MAIQNITIGTIQFKHNTKANLEISNPILLEAERIEEIDTGRAKIGPMGGGAWLDLPYTDEAAIEAATEAAAGLVAPKLDTADLDQVAAGLVDVPESAISVALKAAYVPTISVYQYVNPGEQLVIDGSGPGNNSAIVQRAVDALNTLYGLFGRPLKIELPEGARMTWAKSGDHFGGGANRPYAVRWKSGVGIATRGVRAVTILADVNSTPLYAAYEWGGLVDCHFDSLVVDGAAQSPGAYSTKYKGFFFQDCLNCSWTGVEVWNTWATGFGCDFLRGCYVGVIGRRCGRGIKELGIDPLTTSGGSGVGIGTGKYLVEDSVYDVEGHDCGFHGVFFEWQAGMPFPYSRGMRVRARATGNHTGFRDCGCDGLVAEVVLTGNTYAGVLHDGTILAPDAGINGRIFGQIDRNGSAGTANVVIGNCPGGNYYFGGPGSTARFSPGHGVMTLVSGTNGTTTIGPKITVDLERDGNGGSGLWLAAHQAVVLMLRILGTDRDNGANAAAALRHGVVVEAPTDLLELGMRAVSVAEYPTQQIGLYFKGAGKQATRVVSRADVRNNAVIGRQTEQTVTYDLDQTIGTSNVAPTKPVYADLFSGTNGTLLAGRTLPDGSATDKAWSIVSTDGTAAFGIDSGRAHPTAGTAAVSAVMDTGQVGGRSRMYAPVMSGATSRRCALLFRFSDASNHHRVAPNTGVWLLGRLDAGALTNLITGPAITPGGGDTVEVLDTGTVITLIVNGVSYTTGGTDSTRGTLTKVGIQGQFNNDPVSRIDYFKWFAA